ncbi:hypothetical protein ACEQ8H_000715 [Pleosporales sp. CAS-2024a]
MSQRSRPGSAQSSSDRQRMPFAAAEALLWGKKTAEEHHFIHSRMRELEDHHRAYNNRIKATEVIAEAAEAAITRIRRVEQQVAAIESDDRDRPFDKWVEGEVATFKVFAEKNKTVRQKQIELEGKISSLEDSVDKAKDVAMDLEILMERISRMDNERIKDSALISKLQGEVAELKILCQIKPIDIQRPKPAINRNVTPLHLRPPPSAQPIAIVEDDADETEDEETAPTHHVNRFEQEELHVISTSKMIPKSTSVALKSSAEKRARDDMSARLRVMQRKSIHDPKHAHWGEALSNEASKDRADPHQHPGRPSLPATQIVEKRSNANQPNHISEAISRQAEPQPPKGLVVKLKIGERTMEESVPVMRLTRSQAKKLKGPSSNNSKALVQNEIIPISETRNVTEPPAKRRKVNAARSEHKQATQKPAKLAKNPTQKAVAHINKTETVANPVQQPRQTLSSLRKKKAPKASTTATTAKHDICVSSKIAEPFISTSHK